MSPPYPLTFISVSYAISIFQTHPSEQQSSEDPTSQVTPFYTLKILASLHESFHSCRGLQIEKDIPSALASYFFQCIVFHST